MNAEDVRHVELSYSERQFLELRRLGRWTFREIVLETGRDQSALSREVRRNRAPALAAWVRERLKEGRSPEKAAGRLRKLAPPHLAGKAVCHESICQWAYAAAGGSAGSRTRSGAA